MNIAEIYNTMEYGPALEESADARTWLAGHQHRFSHFIAGEWHAPAGGEYFVTEDPSTRETLAEIAQGSEEDVDKAVNAARRAYPAWQGLSCHTRARYLYALARSLQKHSRRFAVLETLDNGKPIRESRDIDIPLASRHFYYHAGWAQLLEREFAGYTACGVVGQIVPWNFPLLMLSWKIAPALATGNTVVFKPAEYTPLTALLFAEICREIGLPPGVVNVVTGDGKTGELLVRHAGVDKLAFTGSTEVGRILRDATASTSKKLSLELGGKSPFIVFDDADLDSAVEGLVDGIWFNQGQVCCAGSRLLAQEAIAERLLVRLRRRMETIRVGAPLDKSVDMGAIVSQTQLDRIKRLVGAGIEEGAACWQPDLPLPEQGLYYPPTILSNVHPSSVVAQEEIFGPVVSMMTFRTLDEAAELANNTRYGLAGSIWSENINTALDVASQIRAGVLWVNSTNLFDAACGFGGYRESGFGREGGKEGLYEYLEPAWFKAAPMRENTNEMKDGDAKGALDSAEIDRTVKNYVGGKQARPDSGYSFPVYATNGHLIAEAPLGNRKDIRNAVEAAHKAVAWSRSTGHLRAQVLYYLAENMWQRKNEIADRLSQSATGKTAAREVESSVERIFSYAAWADKFDGLVHNPPMRNVALAMNEAIGVIGIVAPPEAPLLALVSLILPAIAMGNRVVAVPSQTYPIVASELYQLLDTSDVPPGVVNLVAGKSLELAKTLAEHDDVDAIWFFGEVGGSTLVKKSSIGNLKQVWTNEGRSVQWDDAAEAEGPLYLRRATQVKNIWVPYGE